MKERTIADFSNLEAECLVGRDDTAHQNWLDNGKEEINKLLYQFLPGNTTLDEMESVATNIYDIIDNLWIQGK